MGRSLFEDMIGFTFGVAEIQVETNVDSLFDLRTATTERDRICARIRPPGQNRPSDRAPIPRGPGGLHESKKQQATGTRRRCGSRRDPTQNRIRFGAEAAAADLDRIRQSL